MKLTHEQIDATEAGREMDALVAELVMGWERVDKPDSYWFLREQYHGLDKFIFWDAEFGTQRASSNGWGYWKPSTDIAAAWQVVEKSKGFMVENRQVYRDDEWDCEIAFEGYTYDASATTAPLAICRAALKAVTNDTD